MKAAKGAHEEIFRRIRAAGLIPVPEIPRDYRTRSDGSNVVAEMEEKLVDYTARVTHAVTAVNAPTTIAEALSDTASVVMPPELDPAWAEATGKGREIHVDEPPSANAELDRVDAVITASRVAAALSDTIVLDGAPDMGRRAISLVPDTHVMVLKASDIKATVPEAAAVFGENPMRPTTWVAGPSATSGIELVRVDSVHGPHNLRVIVIDDGEDNSNN